MNSSPRRGGAVTAALVLGAVLAGSQALQAWTSLQHEQARPAWSAAGTQVSVLLTNGQIYYGELAEQSAGFVRLSNVYYVQTFTTPDSGQPNNQLVNRSKTDWHGPQWMAIPVERIVFVERIGESSRLAELMAQEKKLGAAAK
jgi:hypothetical protein